jgi:hypothetical protein
VNPPPASQPLQSVTPSDDEETLPHCKCGTDRRSKFSVAHRNYTFLGLLYLLWGGTSVPSKVSFRCVKCGSLFETTTVRRVCREHII